MMLNNGFYFRNRNYTLPFGIEDGNQIKKKHLRIRYWMCTNSNSDEIKWVVLLHSWGRNSARMIPRGQIYWDKGYSLIFLDAPSHGQSGYVRIAKAIEYAQKTMEILKKESIESPIVHGLSFGSIAAVFIALYQDTTALVSEATASRFDRMFKDFLRYLRFPKLLFGWIPWIIMNYPWDFDWEAHNPMNALKNIKSPIFLIHGENDRMFRAEDHFVLNLTSLKDRDMNWLVPNSNHSRMAQHPEYRSKLEEFIQLIEN